MIWLIEYIEIKSGHINLFTSTLFKAIQDVHVGCNHTKQKSIKFPWDSAKHVLLLPSPPSPSPSPSSSSSSSSSSPPSSAWVSSPFLHVWPQPAAAISASAQRNQCPARVAVELIHGRPSHPEGWCIHSHSSNSPLKTCRLFHGFSSIISTCWHGASILDWIAKVVHS